MIKRYNKIKYPKDKFIGAWMIDETICDDIFKYYKLNENVALPGRVGRERIDIKVKESTDLIIHPQRSDHPWGNYRVALQKCLDDYIKEYPEINSLKHFNILETYNLQRYAPKGGFKVWHYERTGDRLENLKRCLVFMTYINTVKDAGTEFLYQNVTTPAKKGLTLIWPADWTHTHKGQISNTNEKIILTGWFSYIYNQTKDFVFTS